MIEKQLLHQSPLIHTRKLVTDGRYEDAQAVIARELEAFPDWAEPWALLAQVFCKLSRFGEAVSACDEALLRDPWHLQTQQLKTALLLQLGFTDAALKAAERLVALERLRPESHLFLSFAYSFAGREVDAVEAARQCKLIAPKRGFEHQALCIVHLIARRWQLAEHHALAALKLEGPSATLFHDLGQALERQGRTDHARSAYAMAAHLDVRFIPSLKRFNRRCLMPTWGVPAGVAVDVGALLLPTSVFSVTFAALVAVGVVALMVASFRTRSASLKHLALSH